jgi:hypothetical protein
MTKEFLDQRGIVVVPHQPYSPDLAPADFWLFQKVKAAFAGRRFETAQRGEDCLGGGNEPPMRF